VNFPVLNRMAWCIAIALAIALQFTAETARAQRQLLTYEQAVGAARFLTRSGHFYDALLLLRQLPLDGEERYEILFLRGWAALELSNLALDEDVRDALLDEAIEALYVVASNNPGLLRPRLELARAYFMRGDDEPAKEHFEWVLSTQPPQVVAYNVHNFLNEIRGRRRLTGYFGFALAPDTNIANVYEDRNIMIFGLPFTLDQPAEAKSGVGLSLWGGGEYRLPVIPNKLSLRFGASGSVTDYPGGDFDSVSMGVFAGPHYQFDNRTDGSVVGFLTQRWSGGRETNWDAGIRLSLARQVSEIQRIKAEFGTYNRYHRYEEQNDGRHKYVRLDSDTRLNEITLLNVNYSRFFDDTATARSTSNGYSIGATLSFSLQGGYDISLGADYSSTKFDGNWFPYIIDGSKRTDRLRTYTIGIGNRNFRVFGFSPKLSLIAINKESNVQNTGYQKRRAELSFVRYF